MSLIETGRELTLQKEAFGWGALAPVGRALWGLGSAARTGASAINPLTAAGRSAIGRGASAVGSAGGRAMIGGFGGAEMGEETGIGAVPGALLGAAGMLPTKGPGFLVPFRTGLGVSAALAPVDYLTGTNIAGRTGIAAGALGAGRAVLGSNAPKWLQSVDDVAATASSPTGFTAPFRPSAWRQAMAVPGTAERAKQIVPLLAGGASTTAYMGLPLAGAVKDMGFDYAADQMAQRFGFENAAQAAEAAQGATQTANVAQQWLQNPLGQLAGQFGLDPQMLSQMSPMAQYGLIMSLLGAGTGSTTLGAAGLGMTGLGMLPQQYNPITAWQQANQQQRMQQLYNQGQLTPQEQALMMPNVKLSSFAKAAEVFYRPPNSQRGQQIRSSNAQRLAQQRANVAALRAGQQLTPEQIRGAGWSGSRYALDAKGIPRAVGTTTAGTPESQILYNPTPGKPGTTAQPVQQIFNSPGGGAYVSRSEIARNAPPPRGTGPGEVPMDIGPGAGAGVDLNTSAGYSVRSRPVDRASDMRTRVQVAERERQRQQQENAALVQQTAAGAQARDDRLSSALDRNVGGLGSNATPAERDAAYAQSFQEAGPQVPFPLLSQAAGSGPVDPQLAASIRQRTPQDGANTVGSNAPNSTRQAVPVAQAPAATPQPRTWTTAYQNQSTQDPRVTAPPIDQQTASIKVRPQQPSPVAAAPPVGVPALAARTPATAPQPAPMPAPVQHPSLASNSLRLGPVPPVATPTPVQSAPRTVGPQTYPAPAVPPSNLRVSRPTAITPEQQAMVPPGPTQLESPPVSSRDLDYSLFRDAVDQENKRRAARGETPGDWAPHNPGAPWSLDQPAPLPTSALLGVAQNKVNQQLQRDAANAFAPLPPPLPLTPEQIAARDKRRQGEKIKFQLERQLRSAFNPNWADATTFKPWQNARILRDALTSQWLFGGNRVPANVESAGPAPIPFGQLGGEAALDTPIALPPESGEAQPVVDATGVIPGQMFPPPTPEMLQAHGG